MSHFAAVEHASLRGDHDVGWQFGNLSEQTRVVHKTGDIRGHKAVQHAADADRLTGKDTCVDGGFCIVPHDATDELHTGRDFATVVLHLHFAIGVLQVAIARAGPQINPAAQKTVAQEPVVLLVGVGLDH